MSQLPSIRLRPTESALLTTQAFDSGSIYYDSNKNTLVIMDGRVPGGFELLRADLTNATTGLGVEVSQSPPNNARSGSLWLDTESGELLIYLDDGDSGQWIQPSVPSFSVGSGGGTSYTLPTATTSILGGVKVDGSTITITNGVISSSGSYTLPTASTTVSGGIKIDGSTLAFNGSGQLYYTGAGVGGYTLPTATTTILGGVKVDGSTITINGSGVISSTAGGGSGTVTSVGGTGTVNGLTLTGTVTTSGSLTLGGTLSLISPPAIGSTLPNTGAFTTLTYTDARDTIYTSGSTTGTITPNAANGNVQTITLTGNITLNALASPISGQSITMIITQPATGGPYLLTSTMKFAGGVKTLSISASAVDMLTISYIGTTYYASLTTGFA